MLIPDTLKRVGDLQVETSRGHQRVERKARRLGIKGLNVFMTAGASILRLSARLPARQRQAYHILSLYL